MNRFTSFIAGSIVLVLTASFVLRGDTSVLESKTFKVSITEVKKTGKSGTPSTDEISFKSSKLRCKFFGKNAGADAIPIDLTVDSAYTAEGDEEETLYVEFEGTMTNKLEETVNIKGTVDGYGIEGSLDLSKKGKPKRHYDFVGSMKDKKGKK
jgi:hypothetical protein